MAEPKDAPKTAAGAPPSQGAGAGKAPAAGITKMEAVRRALAALGKDARPLVIQSYISDQFNIEMNTDHISTYKGDLAKKKAKPAKASGPKAPTPPKKTPAPTPPTVQAVGGEGQAGDSILLEDVLTAKDLLDRVGASRLRTLLDGLAK